VLWECQDFLKGCASGAQLGPVGYPLGSSYENRKTYKCHHIYYQQGRNFQVAKCTRTQSQTSPFSAGNMYLISISQDYDLTGKSGFSQAPTVEQIIARGYFRIPKGESATAIISDKKETSWLGLDDIIGQIRHRQEIYLGNMYDLELAKCAAINSLHQHEAHHGPADARVEYALNKRLDQLYSDQRDERVRLWQDISRLRQTLPETAQQYLTAYRKVSILEDDSKGGGL